MKKIFIIIFIYFLNSLANADDIKDFQIEGMSIGDSLLIKYSVEEINENIDPNVYAGKDGKFKLVR